MVRWCLFARVALAAGTLVTVAIGVVSCSGTAVLSTQDPLACEPGHGCGSTLCRCEDETVLMASLCENEVCQQDDDVCDRRCTNGEHGRALDNASVETEESRLAVPFCQTLCTRMQIGGCETGCDPLFEGCEAEVECAVDREAFYECLANEAVLSCEDGAVAFTGCASEALGLCSVAP